MTYDLILMRATMASRRSCVCYDGSEMYRCCCRRMGLQSTTRVIRGGKAVETVYWHYFKDKTTGLQKIVKHRHTLVYPKKLIPKMPNVADQAFSKIK